MRRSPISLKGTSFIFANLQPSEEEEENFQQIPHEQTLRTATSNQPHMKPLHFESVTGAIPRFICKSFLQR